MAGLSAFQIVMSRGQQEMWLDSTFIRLELLIAAVCLGLFVWRDSRRENPNPLLNLRLLRREKPLAAGLALALIFGALLAGSLFVLPQYLRGIQGYNATQTSFFFCVDAIATYVGLVFGAKFAPKLTGQVVVLIGLSLFAVFNYLLILQLTPDTPALNLYLLLVLHGASLGMMVPSVSAILMGKSSPRYLAFDMAIYYLCRGLGSTVGVSSASALLDVRLTDHSSRLLDVAGRLSPAADRVLAQLGRVLHAKGLPWHSAQAGAYQIFQGMVAKQSSILAYADIFWYFQWVALAGIFLVLVTWRAGKQGAPKPAPQHVPFWAGFIELFPLHGSGQHTPVSALHLQRPRWHRQSVPDYGPAFAQAGPATAKALQGWKESERVSGSKPKSLRTSKREIGNANCGRHWRDKD